MATIQDLGKVAYFNKGMYNSETNYEINDVVSYNGSSYVSLLNNNQGNLPTNATYWSVVALKGDKGDTGKPFVIEKTYESIEDMVADYDNMQVNDYVMIQGNIEEEENATLWTKTETEVSPYKWVYLADFSGASGITGATPNIQIGTVTEGNEPSVTRRAGSSNENPILDFVLKTGATGATGATGNGISSVSKTSTSGLTDTYTITYTNGNTTTFNVTNGKGIASIVKTGTSGLVDTYTITYNDGTTSTYTITNGEDGEVTQEQLDETNSEIELVRKIYNAFPTTSDEDESITLNGTAEVQFKNFELKGNTSQETTSISGGDEYDSPSPEHPQDIKVVTGNNSILVEGKNKFNINDTYYKRLNIDTITTNNNNVSVENTNTTTNQFVWWNIPIMVGEEITISYNSLTESISDNNNGVFYTFNDEPYTSFVSFDNFSKVDKTNKYSTITATKKYLVVGLRTVPSCTNTCNKLQIEKGSTASEYEQFKGRQTYSVNLGNIELCKIEDYKDYFYKDSGKWYLEKKIGKLVLDGSETWNGWGVTGARGLTLDLEGLTYSSGTQMVDGYSSHFKPDGRTNVYNNVNDNRFSYNGVTLWIRHNSSATLADFKAWLSTHNTTLYYVLATPTITEITDTTLIEQLDNLENAYSYDTQTNITQTNDDMPFILDVEALMSLKNILN